MNPYYSANTALIVFAMAIMLVAVGFNTVLDHRRKRATRLLFVVISVAALCEWMGNMLDGAPAELIWLHKAVKLVELCLAPYLGLICGRSLSDNNRGEKLVAGLVNCHVLMELITMHTGQIWYVDAQNYYHHGPLYGVYIAFYIFGVVYYLMQGLNVFWRYQQSGGIMILLVTMFLAGGIMVSMIDSEVEITWLTVAFSAIMLYKFYGDILQQVDGLTELGNRWGFEDYLKRCRGTGALLFFDVDSFKQINDRLGHAVGDQCLCTVAKGVRSVYGSCGRCFRIGGDEFCVVLRRGADRVGQLNDEYTAWIAKNRPQGVPLTVSVGCAMFDTNEESLTEAFNRADQAMYQDKNARKAAEKTSV